MIRAWNKSAGLNRDLIDELKGKPRLKLYKNARTCATSRAVLVITILVENIFGPGYVSTEMVHEVLNLNMCIPFARVEL